MSIQDELIFFFFFLLYQLSLIIWFLLKVIARHTQKPSKSLQQNF